MAGIMPIRSGAEIEMADINLAKMLDMPGQFEKFASENLPQFIRETRDYESFGRQILAVHDVGNEDIHLINNQPYVYYPKDLNSHATFYGDDGEIPRYQIEGDGVNVGIITISSDDVTINLKRLLVQKYNYLERVRSLSTQAVVKAEDTKILDLTEKLILGESKDPAKPDNDTQVVTSPDSLLQKNALVSLKKCLSRWDVPISKFVLNQVRIDDILTWATDEIDQLTQREMLQDGVKYSIWGLDLIPSRIVREDTIYAFAEKTYLGKMPILKDLTVKLTETTNKLEHGLFMFEFLGIYISSHRAVAKLILNYKEGEPKVAFYDSDVMAREFPPVKGIGSLEEDVVAESK